MDNISTTHPQANKRHVCQQCGGIINVGIEHFRQTIAEGGEVFNYRAHEDCHEAATHFGIINNLVYIYDEFPTLLNDAGVDDHEWLKCEFPQVFDRLFKETAIF